MTQRNRETIRQVFEAWNRRDFEAALRHFDPEAEFRPGLLPPGEQSHYHGRDGVEEWIRAVDDAWVAVTAEEKVRIDIADDRLLAIDRWHFEGRDGIQVEEELATVFTLRNGLIVEVYGFTDTAEAFEALGLDPQSRNPGG
jgi:ketosteroid isomerase-like protein